MHKLLEHNTCEHIFTVLLNIVPRHPFICLHVMAQSIRDRAFHVGPNSIHSGITQPGKPWSELPSKGANTCVNRLSGKQTLLFDELGYWQMLNRA